MLNPNPGFNQYLYSYYTRQPIMQGQENMCYQRQCYQCYGASDSGYCYNQETPVYGRDAYVKYSDGSIAFGAYLPVSIAEKIMISGGANVRFHFVAEGIQTNALNRTAETSIDGVVKVGYEITPRLVIGVSAEKSFSGFDYRSYAAFITFRW
jgi:hypothetical protein